MQRHEEKQRKRKEKKHLFGRINASANAVIGVLRFDICLDLWFSIYGTWSLRLLRSTFIEGL
jgi:hypothetical protein